MTKEAIDNVHNNAPALLHNMSCAPSAQIQHRSPFRRAQGRGIVFALRRGHNMHARLFGKKPGGLPLTPPEDAEHEVRARIYAHARTLQFPDAALVTDRAEPEDEQCDDLLTIITVLAKSSGHVYLRDKVPNLNQVKAGCRVVLLAPELPDQASSPRRRKGSHLPGCKRQHRRSERAAVRGGSGLQRITV